MTPRARTIQIVLPNGDPRGIRVAALTTSTIEVIEVPRALLAQFQGMPQARQGGLYFLVGNEEREKSSVYIGHTASVGKRLGEHHTDARKDFWSRALVAVSQTNMFIGTHTGYLEWRSIHEANLASRYEVENGTTGTKPHTPLALEADCQEYFETVRTLVATMGQVLFEPLAIRAPATAPSPTAGTPPQEASKASQQELYYCKASSYDAAAQYTEEGMVVLKGSQARRYMSPSMQEMSAGRRRLKLIEEGLLKLEGERYVFQEDILFKSPSGASDVVVGGSSNGWAFWKDKTGKSLDELKRRNTL